jgi:hypothetical protein
MAAILRNKPFYLPYYFADHRQAQKKYLNFPRQLNVARHGRLAALAAKLGGGMANHSNSKSAENHTAVGGEIRGVYKL